MQHYSKLSLLSHSDDEDDAAASLTADTGHRHQQQQQQKLQNLHHAASAPAVGNLIDFGDDEPIHASASAEAQPSLQGASLGGPSDGADIFGLFGGPADATGRSAAAGTHGTAHAAHSQPHSQPHMRRSQSQPVNEEEEAGEKPVIDFEEVDGATECRRELVIYAIPLYRDEEAAASSSAPSGIGSSGGASWGSGGGNGGGGGGSGHMPGDRGLVFLPVANFQEQEDYSGVSGAIREKLDKLQSKASSTWAKMKEKDPQSVGHKVYKVGHAVANNLSVEERLTRGIPANVSKVIIYHPTQVAPDIIMERLTNMTQHGVTSAVKATLATLALPVAFGIDILIIPGPQVLTYYTMFQMYKNTSSALGTRRLTKYIAQKGEANDVRVCYAGEPKLDSYYESAQWSADGVLGEEEVEELVDMLGEKALLEPLLELRARRLKELPQKDEYTALPTTGH